MTPMLGELDNYYRNRGIHSMDFRCCCQGACSSAVKPEGQFTEAKSAFIGTRYEDGSAGCRLLFLGSDPGAGKKAWPKPEQRTPEAIRKKVQTDPPSGRPHWWGTLRFALRILSSFDHRLEDLRNELNKVDSGDCRLWMASKFLNQQRRREEFQTLVTPSFAQANAARCSVNAKGSREADKILYANCHKYLCGEIEVLTPDVIVTQGKKATEALQFLEIVNGSNCQGGCRPNCSERCKIARLSNRKVLWIRTYHPAAFRKGGRPFDIEGGTSWNCYAAAAYEFMKAASV